MNLRQKFIALGGQVYSASSAGVAECDSGDVFLQKGEIKQETQTAPVDSVARGAEMDESVWEKGDGEEMQLKVKGRMAALCISK